MYEAAGTLCRHLVALEKVNSNDWHGLRVPQFRVSC